MRKFLIAGNWKMNGTKASTHQLASELSKLDLPANVNGAIFPAFLHIKDVQNVLVNNDSWQIGAQNCAHQADFGALTGEISANQLRDAGCSLVLVGHSERRIIFGEDDAVLAAKTLAALAANLTPVICVGETSEQRLNGNYQQIINDQLRAIFDVVGIDNFRKVVIAYEPVWAIGTGLVAAAEQAQEVHSAIRKFLETYSESLSVNMQILYGGSLNSTNANELFNMPDINGGLVGGASLSAKEFGSICAIAGEIN